jgi:hypothetical protein
MIIKLTKSEWEILEHRLGQSDILQETREDEGHEDGDAVFDASQRLYDSIGKTLVIDAAALDEAGKWIITECVEQTTFFVSLEGEVEYGEITKGRRGHSESLGSRWSAIERGGHYRQVRWD